MHLALQRVEVPPDQLDQGTAQWAADVRELSYDMEDAVDAFSLHMGVDDDPAAAGMRSWLRGFLHKTAQLLSKGKALHQVASAVSEAKRLAKELGEIHQRYAGLKRKHAGDASDIDPRLIAMYIEAADLIGVDGVTDKLIKVMSDSLEVDLKTISIVGFGGLGKTTLANAVYDKIKVQFDCGAFVSVSRNPEFARIFKKILHQLDKEEFKDVNEAARDVDQLIHELKRYLIVIDDLWDENNWKLIKCAFPKNTCNSRLIITTRKHNVSEASCSSNIDIIHKMMPLSGDDSLRLFHSRIFHHGCDGVQELPQTITGLRNLMCLHLDWDTRLPKGFGNLMSSLEELNCVRVGGDDSKAVAEELGHLTRLRVLTMKWTTEDFGEDLVQSLGNLRKLQSLEIKNPYPPRDYASRVRVSPVGEKVHPHLYPTGAKSGGAPHPGPELPSLD
ncbi:hypothetical protein PR202_ga12149 [Eleusine coracana subsp. coracana]|uniref:NB-ARC domain-containing protein n=1 Tax=Eleusine coracana subsp. coracana TaxID=191504 RepID=A0AAV5CAW5_ELECO|nr:hypothetical protein PR202_ga12149 [Eleusine coracana subsp. coracana]